MLPDICLHADSIKCVLAKKCKPRLHRLRVAIFNLNEPAESNPFKIFLALFVNEVASRDRPAFDNAGEGDGAGNREIEIVGCTNGEIGKKLDVMNTVGPQLEVAHG